MHPQLFQSLSGKILDLLLRLQVFDADEESSHPPPEECGWVHYSYEGSASFSMSRADREQLRKLVANVRRQVPPADRISEKCIDDGLMSLLKALHADEDQAARLNRIAAYFDSLATLVEPTRVFIPVYGLQLEFNGWDVGGVRLGNIGRAAAGPDTPPQGPPPADPLGFGTMRGVYAVFHVEGEDRYARDAAREAARRAMDLLRFCLTMTLEEPGTRRIVALEDEFNPQPENRTVVVVPKSGMRASFFFGSNGAIPPLVPWVVNRDVAAHLQKIALDRLTPLFRPRREKLNTFQTSVIRAVHWMADSQMQLETENRLLSLVTAMESLFTPEEGSPISNTIAEGVAFVVGGDMGQMRENKKLVKRLYKLRSTVSHGVELGVLTADVDRLIPLCRSVMEWMIEKLPEFREQADLTAWIEEQKFTIPPPSDTEEKDA